MVYNGADYMEYAIKSLYPYLYQVIIVEGAVSGYTNNPTSFDGTWDIIKRLKQNDLMDKIDVVKIEGFWNNKIEKQNSIAKKVKGEFYVKLDADEIWDKQAFFDVIGMFLKDKELTVIRVGFNHFWLNFKTIAKDAGGKWSTNHPRVWRWKSDFHHNASFNYFQDKDNKRVGEPEYFEFTYTKIPIFHFGWCREKKYMLEKIEYYKNRGIENFVTDTITGWKNLSDNTQPTQQVRSWAEEFTGKLPDVLNDHPYKGVDDMRLL